ncbi:MAG: L-rhamnose/proton symporter RhaT [bacterium]
MNPFLGVFFHGLGGFASGRFYVPHRFVKKWARKTVWLVGGFFSWIIIPSLLALLFLCSAICIAQTSLASTKTATELTDTRGPVQNAGMTVQVDHEGVQAPCFHWEKPEPKSNWLAHWISSTDKAEHDSTATCLRKEITLDQAPKKVTAWISGDNYLLYVNGIPAGRGSADPGRDFQGFPSGRRFYEIRDLTPFFHQGKNVVAAELLSSNKLLLELLVEYPDGKKVTFGTDASWRGIASPYLLNRIPLEDDLKLLGIKPRPLPFFDAEAEPVGWLQAGYDESMWPACKVAEAPKEQLVMSELPPLMEVRYPYFEVTNVQGGVMVPQKPLTPGHPIIVKGNGQFSVHFDKIMSGRCGIKVKGSKGAEILLLSNETGAIGGSRSYQIALRDGIQTFESRDYYALGTVTVVVRNATSPVEILDVSADFLSQPVEYRGSFRCSDEALNKLYQSGRWSTQICMITHHLDSPQHQEPISDYGDYLIADLVNYYTMGNNPWLAKQDLRKWAWVMEAANYKTFHTSYIFYWLQSLLNYYDFTGDKELLKELTPNVHAVIDTFTSYLGKNGIISEAPNYMFMDWVTVHDDKNPNIKFACHHPPAVIGQGYMTALFYQALGDAIRMSQLTGDTAHAEKYEKLRKQIAASYEKELWNSDRGLYRDGKPFMTSVSTNKWMPADVQMESFSVQNNALATLVGLVPENRQSSVMEKTMTNTNWDVTPYFMHFVFNALDQADLFSKYGVEKMHEYKVISETQTVREMGPERGDYSHGWIASPTYQMPSKILGISPSSPGFATIEIKPKLCGLTWAKGSVPTPHGNVDVSWKVVNGKFTMDVRIPAGTTSRIEIPGKEAHFMDKKDGSSIPRSLGVVEGKTTFEAVAGSYLFTSLLSAP